jgi:putative ATP-dependent endonuclease of the OLD family
MYHKRPMELGIDVLSIRGLSLARCLELCAALDKTVAAIRDNDGAEPDELRAPLQRWLEKGRREVFIGKPEYGKTLEPQLVYHNGEEAVRKLLGITDAATLETWMRREKTEAALRIASAQERVTPPEYMRAAATFIYG